MGMEPKLMENVRAALMKMAVFIMGTIDLEVMKLAMVQGEYAEKAPKVLEIDRDMVLEEVGDVGHPQALPHHHSVTLLKTGVDDCGLQGYVHPVSSLLSVFSSIY
uniref:Putative 3-deoxy-7-phosphoheptulonate synthase n=1 Tax=Procambarus clarkii TaxID=6728 RepID=F5A6C5_PROCL|nr:putative 3-deoxy-7-phosphoheptulonate synthase [Procambarus clarkii]